MSLINNVHNKITILWLTSTKTITSIIEDINIEVEDNIARIGNFV